MTATEFLSQSVGRQIRLTRTRLNRLSEFDRPEIIEFTLGKNEPKRWSNGGFSVATGRGIFFYASDPEIDGTVCELIVDCGGGNKFNDRYERI